MNIVVLVKQVPDSGSERKMDPADNTVARAAADNVVNEIDEYAIEEALVVKEAHGGEVTVLTVGPDSATDATTEADEVGRVINDTVDLEQPIIDAVGLALPFAPTCGPDCAGLCPECGIPLATAEPGHHHEQIDPRWAKLTALLPEQPATDESGGSS